MQADEKGSIYGVRVCVMCVWVRAIYRTMVWFTCRMSRQNLNLDVAPPV